MMIKRKCPNCGEIVESKFCTSCGQDLTGPNVVKICPNCGIETTSKFCTGCGTKLIEEQPEPMVNSRSDNNEESGVSAAALYNRAKKLGVQKVKDLEKNAEVKRAMKEEEAKELKEKQARAAERRRLQELKEEEDRKLQLEKERREAQDRAEYERRKKQIEQKRVYEEAETYLQTAAKSEDHDVAAKFYRKAEQLFSSVSGIADADEKSLLAARKAKEQEIITEERRIKAEQEAKKAAEVAKAEEEARAARIAAAAKAEEEARAAEAATNTARMKESQEIKETIEGDPTVGIAEESSGEKHIKASENLNKSETTGEQNVPDTVEEAISETVPRKTKKGKVIIAVVAVAVVAVACVFFGLSGNESDSSQSSSSEETSSTQSTGEQISGDLIPVEDNIELKWESGEAKLTHYQYEKSEYEGDCVNLYFEFKNPSNEEQSAANNLYADVFQNGVELDEKTMMTIDEEDAAFTELQKDASIKVARGFILNDASEMTVRLSNYDGDEEATTKLSFPEKIAKGISGTSYEDADIKETPIKDGISVKTNTGEAVLTGYYLSDDETAITFCVDFTNPNDKPYSMANNIYFTPFQNGVELETTGTSETKIESHIFSLAEKGATIHCGEAYTLKDKSDITLKMSGFSDDGEVEKEQIIKIK